MKFGAFPHGKNSYAIASWNNFHNGENNVVTISKNPRDRSGELVDSRGMKLSDGRSWHFVRGRSWELANEMLRLRHAEAPIENELQ